MPYKGTTKVDKQTLLDAIRGEGRWEEAGTSSGIKTLIGRRVGVTRNSIYAYADRWPEVNQAIEDERDSMLDFAEQALIKSIKQGNIAAIIFTLKTLGKKRGYIEKGLPFDADSGTLMINWNKDVENSPD